MSKLKVGIVGVGGIARTHIPGWQASADADLVAGSDISEEVLQRFGEENGVDKLHADPEALFSDPDIDIIDICTPNMYHAPLAIAALEAGKHVICEKPLAPTPDDIRQMIAARDQAGKTLMTAQHFRFQGSSKALKAGVLESGQLCEDFIDLLVNCFGAIEEQVGAADRGLNMASVHRANLLLVLGADRGG
jgi:predicted dehydrogenase